MSKIRVGIIGAGGRGIFSYGHIFTKQFADKITVVAFADRNRARAEVGLKSLGIQADIHEEPHDILAPIPDPVACGCCTLRLQTRRPNILGDQRAALWREFSNAQQSRLPGD